MVKYPHILEVWREEDATLNPDGSFTEGRAEWVEHCRCNAHSNGKAQEAVGANGKVITYTYTVRLPSTAGRLEDGTKVRVIDLDGNNLFNGEPKTEDKGAAFYSVQGYDPTGQRHQQRRIWL